MQQPREAMQQEWIVAVAAVLVVATVAVIIVIVVALGSSNSSISSKSTTQFYTICHRRHRTVTIFIVHCHHHRSVGREGSTVPSQPFVRLYHTGPSLIPSVGVVGA